MPLLQGFRTMSGASRAGRVLLKAGSRALPVGVRGGRSKAARGLASSVTVPTTQQSGPRWDHQGLAMVGAVAAAASISLAVLSEAETLEDVLPSFLLERLLREEERPLRSIQDVSAVIMGERKSTCAHCLDQLVRAQQQQQQQGALLCVNVLGEGGTHGKREGRLYGLFL